MAARGRIAAAHLSPHKKRNALPIEKSAPQSNVWFLWRTQVHIPNGISIGSSVLAQLTHVTKRHTDRQTDRPHYNAINRPHLMLRIAMQPDEVFLTSAVVSWR